MANIMGKSNNLGMALHKKKVINEGKHHKTGGTLFTSTLGNYYGHHLWAFILGLFFFKSVLKRGGG